MDELEPAEQPTTVPQMLHVTHWELLIVSLMLVAIYAIRQGGDLPGASIRIVDVVLVIGVLVLAMHASVAGRRTRLIHGVLAGVAIVLMVVGVAASSVAVQRIASAIASYLLIVAALMIFGFVLRQRRVTADTLFGALAGYLAIGVFFAMIYTLIARTNPEAFLPPQPVIDGQTDLYYFSFVTLVSLGYGDIAPASDLVRVLAPIEAVIGAILLAALVGRIVGLLVAQPAEPETQAQLDALTRAVERLGGAANRREDEL